MKLLLDFKANPNAIVINNNLEDHSLRTRSLLSIAVFNSFSEAAEMLLSYGANPNPEGLHPLIATLNNENRESLAILLKGRESEILRPLDGKSFIVHAIEKKSNLLPAIVTIVKEEIRKKQEAGEKNIPKYPPKLKRKQKKELEKAEELNDTLIRTDFVDQAVKSIKCPWKKPEVPLNFDDENILDENFA